MTHRSWAAAALAATFLTLTGLVVYGFLAVDWLPDLASRHGRYIDAVIRYLLLTTGMLFLIGHLVLAWFVFRFSGKDGPPFVGVSEVVEKRWAVVPVLVMCVVAEGGVLYVGGPAWDEIYGPTDSDAVTVEVVGKQFEWFVRYPGPDGLFGNTIAEKVHDARNPIGLDKRDPAAQDDIVLRGRLHLPVDRQVVVRLRSQDVLHSFTVPEFRVKQDVVPGFLGRTQFVPVKTGQYELACAELCGLGHYKMKATVTVSTDEEFRAWLKDQDTWF